MNPTDKGYLKVATVADLLRTIQDHPTISIIRYSWLPGGATKLYYVALWASTEQRGYGGCVLSKKALQEFKRLAAELPVLFENTNPEDIDS